MASEKESERQERVPDSDDHSLEGQPLPDQIGHESPAGTPAVEHAVPVADPTAAPPAVPERRHPVTGAPGSPEPAGAEGPWRTDIPPHAERPRAAAGWDRAVNLDRDPGVIPDPAEVYVPENLREAIVDAMRKYPDRRSAVIPALHAAQAVHGWCSPEAIYQVAATMQVTPAYLSSVASFYDMLNEEPVGSRHVYVCTGVACVPRHPQPVLDALQEEAERQELEDTEIRNFECLGACDMAPMASVQGRYIGPLDPSDAPEIVRAIKAGESPLPGRGLEDADYRLPWGGRA